MSFLYPRKVSIRRPNTQRAIGAVGYQGVTPQNEKIILSNLPASIQENATSGATAAQLPSDARSMGWWRILIPARYAKLGQITERDIVVDDLGKRYQIIAAYWNNLGFNLRAELLEA